MKKILLVMKDLRVGSGVVSVIMNYYPMVAKQKYKIDFLLLDKIESKYISFVKGNIYYIPKSPLKYTYNTINFLKNFFYKNKYDIIHVNIPGPYGALVLKIAKSKGINNRIYHCHCPKETSNIKSFISSHIFTYLCVKRSNYYIACSKQAGVDVFKNKEFIILKNKFDVKKYAFNPQLRRKIKAENGIDSKKIIIGTIGRIEPEKNPFFIVDVISELVKYNLNFNFIWIGNGSLKNKVQRYSEQKKVKNYISFVGIKENINEWYSVIDCLLLPSKYEGLGLVLVEAQCSGLLCIASSSIPKDTMISDRIFFYNLNDGPKMWAKYIYENINSFLKSDRNNAYYNGIKHEFDINSNGYELANIYQEILEKGGKIQ